MSSLLPTQQQPSAGASLGLLLFCTSGDNGRVGRVIGRGSDFPGPRNKPAWPLMGLPRPPHRQEEDAAKGSQQATPCSTRSGFPHCHTHNATFRPQPSPLPCHAHLGLAAQHLTTSLHLYIPASPNSSCVQDRATSVLPKSGLSSPNPSGAGQAKASASRNSVLSYYHVLIPKKG